MDRFLYINFEDAPVSLQKLDECINDIAAGAKGLMDAITETLKTFKMDEKLNYRLELLKAAAGYINHLACDELLPDVDSTEKDYAEFGRVVRRTCDGTPYDEDLAPEKTATEVVERARKGGAK